MIRHVSCSGAFFEIGVKKLATALPSLEVSSDEVDHIRKPYLLRSE